MSFNSNPKHQEDSKIIGIPPNVIKNFNVYEILEPVKITKPNETLLIDFDDSRSEDTTNKTQSSGFDLIDVFENIYVTPQLVTNKPNNSKPVITNIDYEDFFRKLEGGKSLQLSQDPQPNSTAIKNKKYQLDFEQTFDKVVGQNGQIINNINVSSNSVESYDAVDHEDLIDELLLEKSLKKMNLSDVYSKENTMNTRVLSAPVIHNNDSAQTSCQKTDLKGLQNTLKANETKLFKRENNMHLYNSFESSPDTSLNISDHKNTQQSPQSTNVHRQPIPQPNKLDQKMIFNFLDAMECNDFKSTRDTSHKRLGSVSNYRSMNSSNISSSSSDADSGISLTNSSVSKSLKYSLASLKPIIKGTTKNNLSENTSILSLINNATNLELMAVMPIQAVVKDNKAFAKNRLVKNENETKNYTKGPDINEKRIVLPQILDRLGIEMKELVEEKNFDKRLILDVGSMRRDREVNIPVKLDPTVLMEDCNRERLLAFKARQMMDKFVKNGTFLH